MSAREKTVCVSVRQQQLALQSIACVQNLTITMPNSDTDTSCLRFTTINSRIDLTVLRRFIVAKTTAEMLRPRTNTIENLLTGHVERITCEGGVQNLLGALLQSEYAQSTKLLIERTHFTERMLLIQHATPFIHIPDYQNNILRLLKPAEIQPTQWRTTTTAVLHLYTKGITFDNARMFSAPLLTQYIRSPTKIRVKVNDVRPLVQYGPGFPDTLYQREEDRVHAYCKCTF